MLVRFVLTLFLLAGIGQLWGQTVPVTGRIANPLEEPLAGATVRLRLPGGEDVRADVTNARGRFVLRDIGQGLYDLEISFLGYETHRMNIRVGTGPLDLGVVKLEESSVLLESVEVREQAPTATQKEDTVQFNASAFKVMKDASAEDLITKMPSVQTEGGQVKVQGENVGKVLVDGKPFFGNDPSAALKNLPAEVVDKIQIFDQASEQTQFSGIQDGNTVKTINIVTRTDMRAGQFGKVYAGYGSDARYQSGGNINIFDGDRRISLIGMSNNINVQNFASEDILGVLGQSGRGGPSMPGRPSFRGNGGAGDFLVSARGGITRTTAFGLNYSEDWGTKTEVSGSYFFNTGDNEAENDWVRQFLSAEGQGDVTTSRSATSNRNNNHRATMRIDHRIDSMNSLLIRPRFTFQSNNGEDLSASETRQADNLLNQGQTRFGSRLEAWSGEADIMWRHRFAKPRRTLSVNLVAGYAPKSGNNALQSENAFWIPEPATDTIRQQATLESGNWNGSGHWEYTEPVTPNSQLLASYRFSIQQEESDRLTMDYNEAEGLYNLPNDLLSNRFSNDYFTHNGGLGWNYGSDRTFNITARVHYQSASLVNDQILPQQQEFSSTFRNILPFASLRWSPDRFRSIRLFFRSNTRLPGIDQLQNVLNNQNPLQWTLGNPGLRQSASQSLFLRYQYTLPAKSRTLFLMARGEHVADQIVNSIWLAGAEHPYPAAMEIPGGAQLVVPVNLDGAWNLRLFGSYGVPARILRSNLNLDLGYTFQNNPGLVNGQRSEALNHVVAGGITLSSNISSMVDFTVSARPSWNVVRNSLQPETDESFFNQSSSLRCHWQFLAGIVLRTDISHQYYGGLSEGFNQHYFLWNIAIGKKLFRNERGEIAIAVNDLLNQNRSISRTITETWIEDSRTNALTRFAMVSFTYNLRHFGRGIPEEDQTDLPGWRR